MKIKEMETEKLISLLCGDQFMNTKALPEYDIPSLEMSDGPMGLRYQKKDKDSLEQRVNSQTLSLFFTSFPNTNY